MRQLLNLLPKQEKGSGGRSFVGFSDREECIGLVSELRKTGHAERSEASLSLHLTVR
jgi:hypothetical protein